MHDHLCLVRPVITAKLNAPNRKKPTAEQDMQPHIRTGIQETERKPNSVFIQQQDFSAKAMHMLMLPYIYFNIRNNSINNM